jgi:hypothetical protein
LLVAAAISYPLDDRLFCVSTVSRVRTIKALVPGHGEDGLEPSQVHCR